MRALLLFSGGLDSMLVAKILQKQGIEVIGLVFNSYFFDDEKAKLSAKEVGIKLISKDFSRIHLDIVKKPKFGHGSSVNPCIDCHALMFSEAKKILEEEEFDILASGEVLGQRPFSQNIRALQMIEEVTELEKRILRPISAKKLPETIYEEQGMVKRELLEDITGKSRKPQMELAEKYEINDFPSPGGGCRLTEKEFGTKVREILPFSDFTDESDYELLRIGRHYWFRDDSDEMMYHLTLGRNHEENLQIKTFTKENDLMVEVDDGRGPTGLIRRYGKENEQVKEKALAETKELIWKFAKRKEKFNEKEFKITEI